MKYKKKKGGSGNYRDVVNSQKRGGHKYSSPRAKHGIKNASGGVSTGSMTTALMDPYTAADDSKKRVYAKGGVKSDYDSIFDRVSQEQGVPKTLLKALAKNESSFNRDSVSKKGAMGIMQLMPATVKALGITDPTDPYQNISGGAKWLKDAHKRTGNWKDAVGVYNAGPKNWRNNREGVMAQSPKYYNEIYKAIDDLDKNPTEDLTPRLSPSLSDATSYSRPIQNISVPGKQGLFPVQRTTLPSLSRPIPKQQMAPIRSAGEGVEQNEPKMEDWVKLYDNPDLATNVDFVSNLFKKR